MHFLTYAGLAVSKKLSPSFEKVRSAIERGDFRTADLKKLTSHPFFRAKLDYENRLLVSFVEHAGKRACLALEIISQHAYDRSRFLRGAKVDETKALDPGEVSMELIAATTTQVRYLHQSRSDFQLLDKPISFDERQEELRGLPLPLVLVGCAGSGKTALTLTKLRALGGDILYVTHSAFLADSAASLYFAHGYENTDQSVDFLSYRKLLESIEVPHGRAVTLKDFRPFFERHRTQYGFTSPHQLFEELRGVITASPEGPLSEEAYIALGVRQSIYRPEQRRVVYQLFSKYRVWLSENALYDPNLLAHQYRNRAERKYDAVVVDEIQDLTNAELSLVLAVLKDPRGFLLCGDANQIVHPNLFAWSKVKSLFYSEETEAVSAPIHVLEANYRSSRTVCEFANDLLKIKNARFGSVDRESTALVRPASDNEGRVSGLVDKDSVVRELDKRLRGSAQVAVIVLTDDQKAAAKKKFSTPLVFAIHEAKGLEYESVILYGLVSTERAAYREIAAGVTLEDVTRDDLSYARAKDKTDKALEVYKFFVNALYVAITRAVDAVYIIENDTAHPLLSLLGIRFSDDVSTVSARASTVEDWQREARKLELQGKQEQADAIRSTILRTTPVPWTVIDDAGFDDVYCKVFTPNSVFNKAKQQLYEFAAFHEVGAFAFAVANKTGYRPVKRYRESVESTQSRFLPLYEGKDFSKIWADVARYGLEHRNMMGLTPLMMAGWAGNVALVEALLDRGSRRDAVDTFGRMPFHFALKRGLHQPSFATEKLGAMYDLLCPSSIDLQVDGKLLVLSRNQGEFFVLAAMMSAFHDAYTPNGYRPDAFSASTLRDEVLSAFPRSIVPEERRKRTYWNAVLARGEVGSTYRPARKLWEREKMGHYIPSADALLRTSDERGVETFRSVYDRLRISALDVHAGRNGRRPGTPRATTLG